MSIVRIFICGAHSTGKSTLLRDLREYLDIQFEEEIARNVVKRKKLTRDLLSPSKHPDVFEELQRDILIEQCAMEEKHSRNNTDYIADRGIDPVVYAELYLGREAKDRILQTAAAQECIERYRNSLLFVLIPHQQCIVDDGVRLKPEMSELIQYTNIMQELLTSLKIPFHVIHDLDKKSRIRAVCTEVTKVNPGIVR